MSADTVEVRAAFRADKPGLLLGRGCPRDDGWPGGLNHRGVPGSTLRLLNRVPICREDAGLGNLDHRALRIGRGATCMAPWSIHLQDRNLGGSGRLLGVMPFDRETRFRHHRTGHTCDPDYDCGHGELESSIGENRRQVPLIGAGL